MVNTSGLAHCFEIAGEPNTLEYHAKAFGPEELAKAENRIQTSAQAGKPDAIEPGMPQNAGRRRQPRRDCIYPSSQGGM
jgi:hypothetical protein